MISGTCHEESSVWSKACRRAGRGSGRAVELREDSRQGTSMCDGALMVEALRRAGVARMPFRRKGGLACVLTLGATLSIGYFMPNS